MVRVSPLLRAVMRAVRVHQWGGPEVLKPETDVAVPVPGDTEVLVKVHATGVNPVETYIRSGTYARKPDLPYIPGSDAAGVVEAVGSQVTGFKKGDRVYTVRSSSGCYSEYAVSDQLHTGRLSDKLTFSQGASLGIPYYTAYRALVLKAQMKPGETILIHGASGAVGIACMQMAKAQGLRVLGTAGTDAGLQLVLKQGASESFNHREDGYTDKILAATGGEGPDIIIEMLANVNLQRDLEMIKFRGRIVIVGCRGSIEIQPRLLLGKEAQVTGVSMATSSPEDYQQVRSFLTAGAETGWVQPLVAKEYPLEEAATAQRDVIHNSGTLGKLVLKVL